MMEDKFRNVSTKVSVEAKEQLGRILKERGLNEYQFLQLMVEVIIRMHDDRHQMSEEMNKLIQIFQMVPGFSDAATLVDPEGEARIESAVYFVSVKGKKGYVPVMIERSWMDGLWNETRNVKDILEYVVEKCAPDSYQRIRKHMQELECNSVFEALMVMVDAYSFVKMDEEIGNMFDDNQRAQNGRDVAYGQRTKIKQHRTPDGEAMRRERQEEGELDFRPFGVEW